jgi:hypothetical protein
MCKKLIYLISFALVLSLVSSSSAELVAHLRFDDGSGTTAVDSSGHGNNGTLQGTPQWVAGFAAGGLELNGTTDYVDCGSGSSLDITEEITVAVWVKIDVFGDWDGIVTKGIDQSPYAMQMWGDGALRFSANWGTPAGGIGGGSWNTNTKMPAGEWIHAAVTYDGSTLRFYIDGQQDSLEVTQALTFGTVAESLVLGCDFPGGDEYFDGVMDDVRVYDHALTEGEIKELAARPRAWDPSPADGALYAATWASLTWKAGDSAVSHNVYMGESFEDVNEGTGGTFLDNVPEDNVNDPYLVVGFEGFPFPEGLVPGTAYYWRVDEVNDMDPNSPWKGEVWSFWIPPKKAYDPVPGDGAGFVDTDVTLTWTPGYLAGMHTVYFGDDFDTVNNATGGTRLPFTTYTPGALEPDKTYYWRVDEWDQVMTYTGDVWSFKTLPDIPITDPNLVGWWKFDEGAGATAVDWSGHGNHGTIQGGSQWVAGYDGDALDFDGVDDYVVSGSTNVPAGPSNFTIAAWIFPNEHNDDIITWWGQSGVQDRANGFRLMAGGQIRHYFWANDYDITSGDLSGKWGHLALVHDGAGNRRFYLNGQQVIGSYTGTTRAGH